ncbi:siroheme synthase CysG [Beggiatoa leptomitoformis]|uniref:Siroheme synthase n=1 Tax=Beggiatoa leptomitoformis TaxID=288004 RepID=A0A2N9YHQ5_9GAMM|nr:siroheme synthase CysG [Beggiatoa leptomitoformis]AUI70014.1 uroporphyrinogen-III C-methyltransferase [Beggiatoa leptomitoformis]QGX03648.1 uroporphyrinogen-III C-methyltransferase [Beggiatoa leptomitoformis]
MDFFPIFLDLRNQPCLVIGGGTTAARKIELLQQAGALIDVVAPELQDKLVLLQQARSLRYYPRTFQASDLQMQAYRLVIAATSDNAVNRDISECANALNIPVNVVDQPELCSFIVPSMLDRSPLQVAISTGGAAPVLARMLRAKLESVIPAAFGDLARLMAQFRDKTKRVFTNTAQRRDFWETVLSGHIAELVLSGQIAMAEQAVETLLHEKSTVHSTMGEVYLVGGGPGDPDLLTFRALRLMQKADVVLYDRLVSPSVLALVRRDAEHIYVGKRPNNHTLPQEEINLLLARLAKEGKKVLRLKGGDPFIFGRGGEEIETLMAEGVPFQVVPGITAALGTAAYAGIPLTHRDYAQSCIFVTGHLKDNSIDLNWQVLTQAHQTVVVYMGLKAISIFCAEMIKHGMSGEQPAALVQKATTADQKVIVGTLQTLPQLVEAENVNLQSLIIVGDVVKLHEKLKWFNPETMARKNASVM